MKTVVKVFIILAGLASLGLLVSNPGYFQQVSLIAVNSSGAGLPVDDTNPLPVADVSAAQGVVAGTTVVNVRGRNEVIDILTDPEDVWDRGGLWVAPTQARTHNIVSSDVDDTGLGYILTGTATGGSTTTLIDTGATFQSAPAVLVGDLFVNTAKLAHGWVVSVDSETQLTLTLMMADERDANGTAFASGDGYVSLRASTATGVGVVRVYGLDASYNQVSEYVQMKGTTATGTVQAYTFISKLKAIDAGTTGSNEGTITATAVTDATVSAEIPVNANQTMMAIYQIPDGKTGYLMNWYATMNLAAGASALADVRLLKKPRDSVTWLVQDVRGVSASGLNQHIFAGAPVFEARSIARLQVLEVNTDATDISAGFDLMLVNN